MLSGLTAMNLPQCSSAISIVLVPSLLIALNSESGATNITLDLEATLVE